jgi:hypothetical protein
VCVLMREGGGVVHILHNIHIYYITHIDTNFIPATERSQGGNH